MTAGGVRKPVLPPVTPSFAESLGLSSAEWNRILEGLGRAPNEVECTIFSILWSEDCCNKSSIGLTRDIRDSAAIPKSQALPSEFVSIGDGLAVCIDVQPANAALAVDPALGAGAALAASISYVTHLGAVPIALTNFLCMGSIDSTVQQIRLRKAIDGLGRTANLIGLPMAGGHSSFLLGANARPLMSTCCIGVAPIAQLQRHAQPAFGDLVLFVGRKTGFDALPREQSVGAATSRRGRWPKISDVLALTKLRTAISSAAAKGFLLDAAPLAVGGLAVGMFNLADRAQRGLRLDLDKLPMQSAKFTPRALLHSETPERALIVVSKRNHREISDHFSAYGFESITMGEIVDSDYVEVVWHHKDFAIIPYRFALRSFVERVYELSKNPPMLLRDFNPDHDDLTARKVGQTLQGKGGEWSGLRTAVAAPSGSKSKAVPPATDNLEDSWVDLLASPNICSKHHLYGVFDRALGGDTVRCAGEDAVVFRLKNGIKATQGGLAVSVDCNALFVGHEPYMGTVQSVAEGLQNLAVVGAKPVALAYSLNFGDSKNLEVVFQMAEVARGLRVACEAWKLPVLSEKVSIIETADGENVIPTPAIFLLGEIENISRTCPSAFREKGDIIFLIGETRDELGCSEYAGYFHKQLSGTVPEIDFEKQEIVCGLIRNLVADGLLQSAHDLSAGGLAVALTECCISREKPIGASLKLKRIPAHETLGPDVLLFAETPGRFLVSCTADRGEQVRGLIEQAGIAIAGEGLVGGVTIEVANFSVPTATAARIWLGALNHAFGTQADAA